MPTTKISTLSNSGGFSVSVIARPGGLIEHEPIHLFDKTGNIFTKVEYTAAVDQRALNNENKIAAMTPESTEAKAVKLIEEIVKVNPDGSWKSIDWDAVVVIFENENLQEYEYQALFYIYSHLQATEDSTLGENLMSFLSCGTIVDSSDSYSGQGQTVSYTKFKPSPILTSIQWDLRSIIDDFLPYIGAMTLNERKQFDLLATKEGILANNNDYGSFTLSGLYISEHIAKGETKKEGDSVYGTTKWLSPNSYRRVMVDEFPYSSQISIDAANPGIYTLTLPKHISSVNWKNNRTDLNVSGWGKILHGPDLSVTVIKGYPYVDGLGSHSSFSNSFYTDQINFLRPEVKEGLGLGEQVVGAGADELKSNLAESIAINAFGKAGGFVAPFVMIPYDLLKEHSENKKNIATNEQLNRAINGAQYVTNFSLIGGEYKVSTINNDYKLDWQYLSPEKLDIMTAKINEELAFNGFPSTNSAYVENLMLERATFIGAPYGGELSEYDIAVYKVIEDINNEGVSK